MSEPASENIESALFEAWDEEIGVEPQAAVETSEPDEPEQEQPDEEEQADEDAGEEDTTEEAEEEEEETEPEEEQGDVEPESVTLSTSDPALLAYLARYDNDPEKALKAAVELQRVLTRQGREKNAALERVRELEEELETARLLDEGPAWLNPEQQEYVENAIASEQPQAWVQQAVRAGEFDLARAITDQWAEANPYQAMRVSQWVDRAEMAAAQQPQQASFDRNALLQQLAQAVPDMPHYEPGMVAAMAKLGDNHPLVLAAKNGNEQETISAVISLYEIAKASSTGVSATKQKVRQQGKDAAIAARRAAVVQSDTATPSGGQTPRKTMIAPGLSLEDLDAAFAEQS